jgi:hypothetical protein
MQTPPSRSSWLANILFFPIGCLIQTPPLVLFILVIAALAGIYLVQGGGKISFGGIKPDFQDLQINENYTRIQSGSGAYWTLSYEKTSTSVFSGLVRHTSKIQEAKFPFLTHDMLITSGDFADSAKVRTDVYDHHFTWSSRSDFHPQGSINLLHTVPLNEAIYQQLLQLKEGQLVAISGVEVLRINAYQKDGASLGWWQDSGCNTLVVTAVEIKE